MAVAWLDPCPYYLNSISLDLTSCHCQLKAMKTGFSRRFLQWRDISTPQQHLGTGVGPFRPFNHHGSCGPKVSWLHSTFAWLKKSRITWYILLSLTCEWIHIFFLKPIWASGGPGHWSVSSEYTNLCLISTFRIFFLKWFHSN